MLAEARVDVRNRGPDTLDPDPVKDSEETDGERIVGISELGGRKVVDLEPSVELVREVSSVCSERSERMDGVDRRERGGDEARVD